MTIPRLSSIKPETFREGQGAVTNLFSSRFHRQRCETQSYESRESGGERESGWLVPEGLHISPVYWAEVRRSVTSSEHYLLDIILLSYPYKANCDNTP